MEVNMTVRIIVAAALSLGAMQAFGQSLDSGDTAWMATLKYPHEFLYEL